MESGSGESGGARGAQIIEPTAAQLAYARRVAESKATAPHVYFEAPHGGIPSAAALISAVAQSLGEWPRLNGAYRDARFELFSKINVAYAVESEATLVFPVIRDADSKDLVAIAAELSELRDAIAAGSLSAPQLAGATFAVVDFSASGAHAFTPILARGTAATLGVGSASLTLACDSRIVQGSEGGAFLAAMVERLAAPGS